MIKENTSANLIKHDDGQVFYYLAEDGSEYWATKDAFFNINVMNPLFQKHIKILEVSGNRITNAKLLRR